MVEQLKALVGARVSVMKGDEKVSHIAQRESGGKYAADKGYVVAGSFEDLDVSADKYPTFDRPDLGPWLTEEHVYEWDVIIWTKVDRAFRSTADCVKFAAWAKEHKKIIVFTDDGLVLDYYHPVDAMDMNSMMAELFVYLGAFFAQIELRRFRGRALDAHRVLRHMDRWAGGSTPEGFATAPHPSGTGRTLAQDPARQKMLHAVADQLLVKRQSFNGIAKWLQEAGYETAKDHQRPADKKRGSKWSAAQVIGMLTSLNTQGIKMQGQGKANKPVLDDQGNMIRLAPPTFDDATWKQIQEAVKERQYGPKRRVNGASPLGDVVYCGKCGAKGRHRITRQSYGEYRYYNCGSPLSGCSGVNAQAGEVEELLEQVFLEECGSDRVQRRVFVPGEDHTEELERVTMIISALRDDREAGLVVGEEDEARYRKRMRALLDQRVQLAELPQRAAGWEYKEFETTYAEEWKAADTEGRRRLLVDAGVRFLLHGKNQWEVEVPEDMKARLARARAKATAELN